MEITYGMKITIDNPYVKTAEKAIDGINEAATPGKFFMEIFPVMKYIPNQFPGAGWKKKAQHWRGVNHDLCLRPYNLIKDQMNEGTTPLSVCRTLIRELPEFTSLDWIEKEELAIDTCAVSFIGASETSRSAALTFFMAMLLYPEVQKKGQAELDMVLGGHLPEPEDSSSLPYINAMVKETLQWQPVAPLAIPHATTEADEYNRYHIPKGTIVIGNISTLMHNPEVYKNPDEYIPDRFINDGKLNDSIPDPSMTAFGYG